MKLRPYAIPVVWILAGFLSWCLYTYVLARVYGLTGIRISGFIVAANAIPCYYHVLQFLGFFRHNAGLSLEPLGLMIPGFISCILISPFSAVLGGILGKFWRQKLET